jgi:hypothetical protein
MSFTNTTGRTSMKTTLYTVSILDQVYTFASLNKAKKFAASFTKPCFGEVVVWVGHAGGMRA